MSQPTFQVYNLSEVELGDFIKAKVKEALQEARQVELQRAIVFAKSDLEEALDLTRQQVHNWYLEKIIVPVNDSAIKKEFTEQAIRAGLQKLSPTKREKYEQTLNQYIERKFRITIK